MPSSLQFLIALVGLGLSGCINPALTPMDPSPLPTRGALETAGGYELSIDLDGTLVSRPARGDVEAALGASLAEVGTRVVVTGRMRAETPLQAGDTILRVRARSPQASEQEDEEPKFSERALAWYPVNDLGDLRGYDLAWIRLQLEVERAGEVEVLEFDLGHPDPVAVRFWEPGTTRKVGFLACRVQSLPLHLRPARARSDPAAPLELEPLSDDAILVLWVATDSTFGVAGLRPLQIASFSHRFDEGGQGTASPEPFGAREMHMLLRGEARSVLNLRDPDGRVSEIAFDELTTQQGSDLEVLWIVARVEDDPVTTRVLIGPSGWIYAHRRDLRYNPRSDRYERSGTWSMALGLLAGSSTGEAGRGDATLFSLGLPNTLDDSGIDPEDDGFPYSGPFAFDWD